jgi:hypothetical protein
VRILYSTTVIADDNLAVGRVASGLTWNGEPLIDVVNFFRDTLATVIGRGDGAQTLAFELWYQCASEAEAVTFFVKHRDTLPLQADLLLTDAAATYALRMASAVRSVQMVRRIGLAVLLQYKFTGRQFLSEDVPDTDPEDEDLTKYGTATPAEGDESIVVAFATDFGAPPRFFDLKLVAPGGQPPIIISGYSVPTASGFTVYLAAALPAGGYVGYWKAEL